MATSHPSPPTAAETNNTGQQQAAESTGKVATVEVDGKTYEFELTQCLISAEDLLVYGPGSESGTEEDAFLSIDFATTEGRYTGGVTVSLGVTESFASSDDEYSMETTMNPEGFQLQTDEKSFSVQGMFYPLGSLAQDGTEPMQGSVRGDC